MTPEHTPSTLIILSMMAPIMAIVVVPMIVSVVYEKFRTH